MNYSKDIIPLNEDEIIIQLGNLKKEHMHLRFQQKLGSINPSQINKVKKDIARLNTRLVEINRNKNKNAKKDS